MFFRRHRYLTIALFVAGALIVAGAVQQRVRQPRRTPIMRGEQVAERLGCFGCHGPSGLGGHSNPESYLANIPPLGRGAFFNYYAQDDRELVEWILKGVPDRLASVAGEKNNSAPKHQLDAIANGRASDGGVIRMPAYEGMLSNSELEDLVTYIQFLAKSSLKEPEGVQEGRQVARQLGCFSCHGEDGRGGISNPKSFKGIIPPWDSDDYTELVRSDGELEEWILNGQTDRFKNNPLASFFLNRQAIQMPAYRDVISPRQLAMLKDFIYWVRSGETNAQPMIASDSTPQTRVPLQITSRIEHGEWLYRKTGCVTCHGESGRGSIPNPNAVGGFVPELDVLAERMGLMEQGEAQAIISAVENGYSFKALRNHPPVEFYEDVWAEYVRMQELILTGSHPSKHDADGQTPPMIMPGWSERMHGNTGPLSASDIDALIVYLMSQQDWGEVDATFGPLGDASLGIGSSP